MAREIFHGSDAPEWQGEPFAQLARICAGRLTEREANCLNCYVRGFSLRRTGEVLGIVHYRKGVYRHLRSAVEKLGAVGERRPVARDSSPFSIATVLDLIRTVDCNPRPLTYDSRGRPVTIRARILTPDDFRAPAMDWLDDLELSLRPDLRGEMDWGGDGLGR